jgi:F0F1-type ATP synthase assembly protein I
LSQAVYNAPTDAADVEELVTESFIKNIDTNIDTVQKSVINDKDSQEMLGIYDRLLRDEIVNDDPKSEVKSRLKLYGLVKANEERRLQVRNEIYKKVFDRTWVDKQLANQKNKEVAKELSDTRERSKTAQAELRKLTANYKYSANVMAGLFILVVIEYGLLLFYPNLYPVIGVGLVVIAGIAYWLWLIYQFIATFNEQVSTMPTDSKKTS